LEWRREMGFKDDDVVVSFVSRLVVEKGLDVFAEVVRTLQHAGEHVRCLVVGEGPASELLREAVPRAVFLGHREGLELARAYASSDIFLFPSETETFGNVTLEAMASGVPTVCADATGSSSLVLDGKTGFLVTGRDVEAFAEKVRQLVRDADMRQQMGHAARAEAETYSWRLILGRINAYYDTVLAS
jgi:phosphatidylinositol alpha 1,6-mannosyltransferase